jgi:DNA-binding NtrC family response regulator
MFNQALYSKVFQLNKPVLITGASGTGKSTLAKKIHENVKQPGESLLHLNILTLNKNLFESELFGHKRGSFSGAISDKGGFCAEVGNGTLLIDEIGDLDLSMQGKLLTLIDERKYYSVGCTQEKKFLGRLIFATNKNLEKLVESGLFRKDLYYRLRFYLIPLVKLSDRSDKFEVVLAEISAARLRCGKLNAKSVFDSDVLNVLLSYDWPGNYRELAHTIEYLLILEKNRIEISDLPIWLQEKNLGDLAPKGLFNAALSEFEETFFKKLLLSTSGRINASARRAGISKVTLISKLKKYGINRLDYKSLEKVDMANGF